ncbi:hypothetical protein O0L34_g1781 [Tuta absoluta]|nr:hypothetical protein O0L34_g1781 [Tuta absoluta]
MARLLVCLILLAAPSVLPESPTPFTPAAPVANPAAAAEPRVDPVAAEDPATEEPPEGYYAFVESPNATPPRVRGPPYRQVATECAGAGVAGGEVRPHVTANNLCGDLNRGLIPRNPMGQNPSGEPYPFELIRNHTLRFLSRTLPVLRADDTLPRVAHLSQPPVYTSASVDTHNSLEERSKRSLELEVNAETRDTESVPSHQLKAEHRSVDGETPRESRKFCDGGGV